VPQGYKQADLERGFITTGLFAYSRHPNFFAEQSIWFMLYQWSCFATNNLYSYTGLGSLLLVMLFQGSTWLTEGITLGKYPEYREYQKQVGMFIPSSFKGYQPPPTTPAQSNESTQPRVIRTSELLKRMTEKEKQK
jgi:steroid 5-alpha reductase family enzyme